MLNMTVMFDKSHLPPVRFEFAVVFDSYFILGPEPYSAEFESVREWPEQAAWALKQAASLDADFVIHLGDLAEENPAREDYLEVRMRTMDRMKREGVEPY